MTEFSARPSGLAADILRQFGKYPMGPEVPVRKSWRQLARMRDQLVAGARRKGELARSLLGLGEWDFFVVVFSETHRAGHLFWPTPSAEGLRHPAGAMLAVYQAVDDAIGRVLEGLDLENTTLIIFAAHGMGQNNSQEHFTRRIMDRVNRGFSEIIGDAAQPSGGPRQRSVMRLLRERLPARLQHAIGQLAPARVRDFVVDRAITAGHDWARTPALAVLASVTGYVRFNLRGRERLGMLDAGSETFARYASWMRDCFEGFRIIETGQPLVKEITLTREAFPGPRQGSLPDVVISWTDAPTATSIHSPTLGTISAELPTGRAGNHHPDGFAIVVKRNGERGVAATPGDILDLKPMVFRELLERV